VRGNQDPEGGNCRWLERGLETEKTGGGSQVNLGKKRIGAGIDRRYREKGKNVDQTSVSMSQV